MSTSKKSLKPDDSEEYPVTAAELPILLKPVSILSPGEKSVSQSMTDPYASLVEGKSEIKRVIAMHDYHDSNERYFQFNSGDEIAVFQLGKGALGKNLRTGKAGIFPPSCVRSLLGYPKMVTVTRSTLQKLGLQQDSTTEGIDHQLRNQFDNFLATGVDPKVAFSIVKHLKGVDRLFLWGLFCIAYPTAAKPFLKLDFALCQIQAQINGYESNLDLAEDNAIASSAWQWRTRWSCPPSELGQWTKWYAAKDIVQKSLSDGSTALAILKELEDPALEHFNDLPERLEAVFEQVKSEISRIEGKVETARQEDMSSIRALERATREACEHKIKFGLHKTGSFTSSADLPVDSRKIRSRILKRYNFLRKKPEDIALTSPTIIVPPFSQRLRQHSESNLHRFQRRWWEVMNLIGQTRTVLAIVSIFLCASAAITAVATWQCPPPDSVPTIDSNFWSTTSSAIVGILSLYCTIIPILLQQELKVRDEKLFRYLLSGSLLTAAAAVIVYPFQIRTSILLLALSSYAQLATTLQIIMGAVTKIQEDVVMIENQESEIRYLSSQLAR